MADKLIDKVKAAESELQPWIERMDLDEAFYFLENFELKKWDGSKFKDAYPVTRNTPMTYAHAVMGDLTSAEVTVQVESEELSLTKCGDIESFLDVMRMAVNHRSSRIYRYSVDKYNDEFFPVRGSSVARIVFQVIDGVLIPDMRILDPRWFRWQWAGNGEMEWGGPRMMMTLSEVLRDFGKDEKSQAAITKAFGASKLAMCTDYWDLEQHAILVDDTKCWDEDNKLKHVPYVLGGTNLGTVLVSSDRDISIRGMYESIFAPLRHQFPEENRLASVEMTMAMEAWRRAQMMTGPAGEMPMEMLEPLPDKAGGGGDGAMMEVIEVKGGTEVKPFYPLEDLHNAAMTINAKMASDIQRAQFSNIDYGDFGKQDLSGSAMRLLSEKRKRIVNQLTAGMEGFWNQCSEMAVRQMIDGGIRGPLGAQGKKKYYKGSDLQGEYSIEYHYLTTSPEHDISRFDLGKQGQALGFDLYTILDIMEWPEPERVLQRASIQRMREAHPLFDAYLSSIDMVNLDMQEAGKILAAIAGVEFDKVLFEAKKLKMMGMQPEIPQQVLGGPPPRQLPPGQPPKQLTSGKGGTMPPREAQLPKLKQGVPA